MTLLAFARAAFQQRLAYRVANLAGLFTNAFFLFFRAYVLAACFAARDHIGGMDVHEAVTYASVTQAILMVAPQWGAVGVAQQVRSGQIAVELLRPVDYVLMYFGGRLGVSAYYVVMRMLPLLAVAAVAGLIVPPHGLLGFAASLALAAVVANGVLFLVEVSSFWIESERGLRYLFLGFALLPSGLSLPLSWFPEPIHTAFLLTPFPYTMHLPAEVWLGRVAGADLAFALAVQAAWAVGLVAACRLALAAGTRRLVIVGG